MCLRPVRGSEARGLNVRSDERRQATILRILNHFRTPHDFLRLVDTDGRQLPPEHKWKGNNVVSALEAAWLQA